MPDHQSTPPDSLGTLTVHTEALPDQTVLLTLKGTLDHHTSDQLTQTLHTLLRPPRPAVLLDLSGVSFIDSTGLTCLLQARRAIHGTDGTIDLIAPSPPVRNLLDLTGVNQVFPIHPDRPTAQAAHRKQT
ncbi:STAS domain-containing protein [Streptomyces sp. DSM 118148]|uniref:STAS domain-containing protein n=1 Tax=Streptomyces sp. DSM 118148 TaxID=3448667 RepID=UPI00403FFA73